MFAEPGVMLGLCSIALTAALAVGTAQPAWESLHGVSRQEDGSFTLTVPSGSLFFTTDEGILDTDRPYLLLEIQTDGPADCSIYWLRTDTLPVNARNMAFRVEPSDKPVVRAVDLSPLGRILPKDHLRLNVSGQPGMSFTITRREAVGLGEVPAELLPTLIDFRTYTSKLHFLPDEPVPYRMSFQARSYPYRQSAKLARAWLEDSEGRVLAEQFQHFGIQPVTGVKELFGVFPAGTVETPGVYHLKARVEDLKEDFLLEASHQFGVVSEDDIARAETPFKFLKDFSIVRGPDGLWHLFSITGDFVGTHEWYEDGQERTFSHSTSPDLKHWAHHKPVLSITDHKYPDEKVFVNNRNIWAPQVILHEGVYYMFYTSVNDYTSQTISLATSPDLFNWTDHPANPVFTLEGVEWAAWRRDGGAELRDPVVIREGDTFYLYATATANSGDMRGVVVVAQSEDLLNWRDPRIAVRAAGPMESPQVWKSGERFYMLTSSIGSGTFSSSHPAQGWQPDPFPRTPLPQIEEYVRTSGGYAEEVVPSPEGEGYIMAAITWRTYGNSIYFFRILTDPAGRPVGYEPIR